MRFDQILHSQLPASIQSCYATVSTIIQATWSDPLARFAEAPDLRDEATRISLALFNSHESSDAVLKECLAAVDLASRFKRMLEFNRPGSTTDMMPLPITYSPHALQERLQLVRLSALCGTDAVLALSNTPGVFRADGVTFSLFRAASGAFSPESSLVTVELREFWQAADQRLPFIDPCMNSEHISGCYIRFHDDMGVNKVEIRATSEPVRVLHAVELIEIWAQQVRDFGVTSTTDRLPEVRRRWDSLLRPRGHSVYVESHWDDNY